MSQFTQDAFQMRQPNYNKRNWPLSKLPESWKPLRKQVPWGNNKPRREKLPFKARHPIPWPIRALKDPFSGGMNPAQVVMGHWADINFGGRVVSAQMVTQGGMVFDVPSVPNIGFIQYQVLLNQKAVPTSVTAPVTLFSFNIPADKVGAMSSVFTGLTSLTYQSNYIFSLIYNSQDMLHGVANSNNQGLVTSNNTWKDFGESVGNWPKFLSGTTIKFVVSAAAAINTNDQVTGGVMLALLPKE